MTKTAPPPYRTNAGLAALAFLILLTQLVLIPLALLPDAPGVAAMIAVLLSLTAPFTGALMHEAIHGRFAEQPARNDAVGRAIGILTGVAFDAMRFGHMSHHRFNRHALDRPDVIEPGSSGLRARTSYYAGLLGGIYLREVGASLAMLLPRRLLEVMIDRTMAKDDPEIAAMREAMRRGLDRRLGRMRVDVAVMIALHAVAFTLYGAHGAILALALLVRGIVISLMDNAPHYGTPAVVGAGAHNARAGRWASLFLLNQNLHAVHHDRPELPWTALPQAFDEARSRYAGGYLQGLLRQFRGPWRAVETTAGRRDAERMLAAE